MRLLAYASTTWKRRESVIAHRWLRAATNGMAALIAVMLVGSGMTVAGPSAKKVALVIAQGGLGDRSYND